MFPRKKGKNAGLTSGCGGSPEDLGQRIHFTVRLDSEFLIIPSGP